MRVKWSAWAATILISLSLGGCGLFKPQPAGHYAKPPTITILPSEGMWVYNRLPVDRVRDNFSYWITKPWADNLQKASTRIGASGAFVSPDGLILTNHHVAAGGLQNASGPGKDYVTNGFLAKSRDQEIKLPGLELSVLVSVEDVTDRVNDAVNPKLTGEDAVKARNAVFAKIEAESKEATGLQSSVVTLFGGAIYDLYRYKRYTDIRCVFAPEVAVAFFGGDPDNFEYPRYDLDITLLRAYEDGKPVQVQHYLRLSLRGVREGDLVFVSGHPGTTDRLLPVAALTSMRDLSLPFALEALEGYERTLLAYSDRGPEERRQAQRQFFGVQNSLKALRPRLAALKGDLIDQKRQEETSLRDQLNHRADLRHYDRAWSEVATAEQRRSDLLLPYAFVEQGRAFSSSLFGYARALVRAAAEKEKPDDERLPEYTTVNFAPLEHRLLAAVPIYPDLETATLTDSLKFFREKMGEDSPLVKQILGDKSPGDRAKELVSGTNLADAAERKKLLDGGTSAIESSEDPMIVLARSIDPEARKLRRQYEAQVSEPITQALTLINRARFAIFGAKLYPDATGTLRLAYGIVKGYEQDGQQIPAWTTIGGAFQHEQEHDVKPPYALPESWHNAKDHLNLVTPLNFVSTADITNGNSGSPVVDRDGYLVGIIFDSNRQGVANNYQYTDVQARAVSVDSRAIIETLRNVYGADALLDELLGERRMAGQ